jgi:hypothetical protein
LYIVYYYTVDSRRAKQDLTGAIYDHLLAIALVSGLFAATIAVLPSVGYLGFLDVDQQQLRNVALSALNTMLLDAGYPINWGSANSFNPASVVRFGLASTNSSDMYVLDSDKVQKLVTNNPPEIGSLSYEQVRSLLGLQGYGFKLKIMVPFNATVKDMAPPTTPGKPTQIELSTIDYQVTVKLNDGKPVPNAVVNGLIYALIKTGGSGTEETYIVQNYKVTRLTGELGICRVQYSLTGEVSDVIVIFEVTVGDVHTVLNIYRRGSPPDDDIANVNVSGDWLILTTPPAKPRDNRWLLTVQVYTGEGTIVSLYNGTKDDAINWGSISEWLKNFPGLRQMDPVLLILSFLAVEKNSGRRAVFIVGPFPRYLGGRIVSFGFEGEVPGGLCGVKINRVVSISGMTYIAEFTLWKER